MTDNYLTFQLPKGYTDESGTCHREVEMNPLTGKEEELVAQNHGQVGALPVAMVLSRCLQRLGTIAPVPVEMIGRLPGEDRQFLLLKLREITFGDRVQAAVSCPWPGCGNKVDINFSIQDITNRDQVDEEPQINLELEANCPACGREFTIPFDIAGFFFRELKTTIDLLYREVHFLAYHYHWSEREILEMTREKRHKYIEILLEELEKMTDMSILPPGGFQYGNVNHPFMLETQSHRSLSSCRNLLEEDEKTAFNGTQNPIDDDDRYEPNYHREKTQHKAAIRKETIQDGTHQDSEAQDTEIKENPAEKTGKRENIEIPGWTEKSAAFPSLDVENPRSIDSQLNSMPGPGHINSSCERSGEDAGVHQSRPKNNIFGRAQRPNTVDLAPPAARGSFEKPPLDPVKLFINKRSCLKSTALARKSAIEHQADKPDPTKSCLGDSPGVRWSPVSTKMSETGETRETGNINEKSMEIQIPGKTGWLKDGEAKGGVAKGGVAKGGEAERIEKSAGNDKRTGENKLKLISTEEMVSRSNPEPDLRIERLREQLRRLNEKKSSSMSHSSPMSFSSALSQPDLSLSSSGVEETEDRAAREIKTAGQPAAAGPPDRPVTTIESRPSRFKTGQRTSAFWERSYLARYHLRILR